MSSVASLPASSYIHPTAAGDPSRVVVSMVCVLGPRACVFAGLNREGELMTFEQHLAPQEASDWDEAFLQEHFDNYKLFTTKAQSGILLCDPRQMAIPEPLYKEARLKEWMRTCYFVEKGEDLVATTVSGAACRVATVYGASVVKRVSEGKVGKGMYAAGAVLLYGVPQAEGECARVLLTADSVGIALWRNGQLRESLFFPETDGPSVAFRLHSLLHKTGMKGEDVTVYVETLTPVPETVALLSDYWKVVSQGENSSGDEAAMWQAMGRSFSRVRSCVL